ncbi:MAG TPA: FlgD immunoglobulin-like domain containing protein, partial [Candidatus Eisenbacteria bacterium]
TETWFDRGIEECRVSNGRTIVAGDFWMVDGKTARFLAVDSGTGFAFPTSPNGPRGGADMPVRALLPYRDRLVVGGSFVALSGQSHPFLAIGDGRHWDSPGGGVDNGVFALTEFEGGVVAAGDFTTAGGRPASRIALWDGAEWHPLGDGFDDRVMALVVHEGRLYAGGWFRHSGSRSIRHLAVWDGTNWASAGDIDGSVNALASFRGVLYAGGLIRNGDGVAASSLVRFDGATWEPVADLKGIVLAMASNGHELAIAGQLRGAPWVGGPAVVLWNGSDALPLPWQDTRLPSISAVAWTGRGLVVGGNFEHVKSPHLRNLARWNGSDWESFGTGIDRSVLAVADVNGSLFVGGNFESAGDRLSERLARWDDGAVPLVVDGVTVDRDESRVRLSWNGSGVSNVRRTEVWVGPAESWMSGPAEGGSGTFVGTATDIGNGHFEFVDDSARADGTSYWFRQLGPFEDDSWSGPWALAPLPAGLRLLSIGPNPFLGSAEIHYSTAHAGPLRIDVFDAQGRRVRQLADGEHPAGIFTLAWDGRAESGSPVAAGTYWVRLATRDGIQSRRILRLR